MKKILIFPDFDKFGGTRTYFKNLIDLYHSDDCQIVVVIDQEYCDEEILKFLKESNVKIKFLSVKDRPNIFSRFYLSIFVDLFLGVPIIIRERPEIVLISTQSPGKFLGLLLFPLKLIYILHSYPSCTRPVTNYRLLFYKLLLMFSLNERKRILTVSKFSQDQIIKCWFAEKRPPFIHFIYNFSTLEDNSRMPTNNTKKEIKKVLTLGHVRWYKNPEIWYAVARKTIEKYQGDVEFIWAGEGDLLETYREKVRKDNFSQIKFLGFQENVEELYNNSSIYFQPSLLESHGIAVLDAMVMSLPCIVSNAGGLPESVIEGQTGYVIDSLDADSMVTRIVDLLENENLRKSMGIAGKEHYSNKFSHKKWIKEMKSLNEKLG